MLGCRTMALRQMPLRWRESSGTMCEAVERGQLGVRSLPTFSGMQSSGVEALRLSLPSFVGSKYVESAVHTPMC